MKKILAIVLALCLALSLSMTAFAVESPAPESPVVTNPGTGSASSTGATVGKYTYSVTNAAGLPLTAVIDTISAGDVYNELSGAGVVVMYYINITAPVSADEVVSIDVYAPGATADCAVVVRDAWEVLPEVTMTVNGNRATITGPAGVFNTWHYVAIVTNADSDVIVKTPQEPTETDEEPEEVEDDNTPVVDVEPEDNAPATNDSNPTTGIALAVVPMIVAAAAVVVSKKR